MSLPHFGPADTAHLLPFPALLLALRAAAREYAGGQINCPERLAVALPDQGRLLSMPAVAADLALHKLVNVCPANPPRGLPTIQGLVTAYDARTGTPLFSLDARAVTARRTAAISLLALRSLFGTAGMLGLIAATALIGANQYAAGQISLPVLLACIGGAMRSWESVKGVEDFSTALTASLAAAGRLREITDANPIPAGGSDPVPTGPLAITAEGVVGPIGGIQQKMAGAKRDGAEYFLAPAENCTDVIGHVPSGLTVVRVRSLAEAHRAVEAIGQGRTPESEPGAFPACT